MGGFKICGRMGMFCTYLPRRSSKMIIEGYRICGRMCMLCTCLPNNSIKHHTTGTIYNISQLHNYKCYSQNLMYIGETGQHFCDRFTAHRGYVNRKEVDKPIGLHFNITDNTLMDMTPMIIEEVRPKNDPNIRLIRKRELVDYTIPIYGI